jgi:signal transduction histidine kinase
VTLAQRLLVAIGVLTTVTTLALGLGVREAWRRNEEAHFRDKFLVVQGRLASELRAQVRDLPPLVRALCDHDPVVDSALIELGRDRRLSSDLRTTLPLRVRDLMQAMRLDELTLLTESGEILGAGHEHGSVGKIDPELARMIAGDKAWAVLSTEHAPKLVSHCARSGYGVTMGFVAARHVDALFSEIGESYGVKLSLAPVLPPTSELAAVMQLPELGAQAVYVSQPRIPLEQALARLDTTLLLLGVATFALAFALAILLTRGLTQPIVDLSRQARAVVHGDPQPVLGRGGRELEELAEAFNRALADLASLRKRLAATERIAARREIARRVAHEIKNPLAPIRAAVETLRRLRARSDPAFDEYFDEATRTVLDEVLRISNIVSEFTRFARLPPPNPAPLEVLDVARQVVGLHATTGTPIELVGEPCPSLNADRDQLVQVLTNLVQNALEAVQGRPSPRVRVEVRPAGGDRVLLRVQDNGPGVPPELQSKLFEPYVTTKPSGTGLGLSIAQRIVVEHAGEIRYTDAAGGGAVFTVLLPVAGPTLLPEPPSVPLSEPPSQSGL